MFIYSEIDGTHSIVVVYFILRVERGMVLMQIKYTTDCRHLQIRMLEICYFEAFGLTISL